jgi:hypothetical protein
MTELTAKANIIFFVPFDGKNFLQKCTSNNFEFKKNTVGTLSIGSFRKLPGRT